MLTVLLILVLGLLTMARGGTFNAKYGNLFMRLRVLLQGVAVFLFAMMILFQVSSLK